MFFAKYRVVFAEKTDYNTNCERKYNGNLQKIIRKKIGEI